jgi:hypothetical protein
MKPMKVVNATTRAVYCAELNKKADDCLQKEKQQEPSGGDPLLDVIKFRYAAATDE